MNVTFAHSPLHTPEQVQDIIRQAVEIANGFDLQGHRWQPVFIQACQLLGARASTALVEQPAPLDLTTLRHSNRHG